MIETSTLKIKLEEIRKSKEFHFNNYMALCGSEKTIEELIKESEEIDKNNTDKLSDENAE